METPHVAPSSTCGTPRSGHYPDVVALELGAETVTYRELGRRVDAAAARLTDAGPRVGVCVGKSLAGPVAYLAALVSGRAAVPISPQAPAVRVAAIIAVAGVTTVLTDGTVTPDSDVTLIDASKVGSAPETGNAGDDRPPRGTEAYSPR